MIYKVTENEFQFLLVFSEITMLTPNELTNPDLLEDVGSLLESLKAKGYFSSENNEYYMPEELTFFMNVIRNPYAVFTLTAESKKMWVFFKEDAIILMDSVYQFVHWCCSQLFGTILKYRNIQRAYL